MDPNENIAPKKKELLDQFASLYRNSDKGNKGRGKGSTRVIRIDFDLQEQRVTSWVTSPVNSARVVFNAVSLGTLGK